jgi:hypothetical protein
MQILISAQKRSNMKPLYSFFCVCVCAFLITSCDKDSNNPGETGTGTGGSLARFTIAANHLYIADGTTLHTYSLNDPANPQKTSSTAIGWNIETIFPWKDKLFIGSRDAMYIFSIANPDQPASLGMVSHFRACDPVIANDSIAYVTVRSGSSCGGNINALLVYNIKQILAPDQRNAIPLVNPYGLGMKGNRLFICDGAEGLKIFDISIPYYPTQIEHITGDTFYDCIPYDDTLICMIQGGIALYDISDPMQINLLGKITN